MAKTLKISTKKQKKNVIKGPIVGVNASILSKYKKKLERIAKMMVEETTRRVLNFFEKGYVDDFLEDSVIDEEASHVFDAKSPSSQARIMISKIAYKYSKIFNIKGKDYAEWMAKSVNEDSASRSLGSLEEMTGKYDLDKIKNNRVISEYLKSSVSQGVSLISNINEQYMSKVEGIVYRAITAGGVYDIKKDLIKLGNITEKRAKFIAVDQVRKASNNLNAARFQAVGVSKFIWRHSKGGLHPRKLHESYDGEIFSFSDPPIIDERTGEKGIPGQVPNCRCTMGPVFDLNDGEEKDAA